MRKTIIPVVFFLLVLTLSCVKDPKGRDNPLDPVNTKPASTETPTPVPQEWIYFGTGRDGNSEIYKIKPDGSGLERITNTVGDEYRPRVSPANGKIVYDYYSGGSQAQVWIMNLDGSNPQQLVTQYTFSSNRPVWFSDESKILFAGRDVDGPPYSNFVSTINQDATGFNELFSELSKDFGTFGANTIAGKILYSKNDAFNAYSGILMTADLDGTNKTVIDSAQGHRGYGGAMSPDGTKVLCGWPVSGGGTLPRELYMYDIDGGNKTRLTYNPNTTDGTVSGCCFSPDNTKIVYGMKDASGDVNLYIINTDGTNNTLLENLGGHPNWVEE